ncbi:MAG: 3-hydroxyacyl-CoA dehydrogenase NAD-binding domain-containing protein, partial [Oscillospiraceae bacterium]|nr:3-hydroxyacyl-CoA dehydrogenase NAD-binding domain-containing protein [Oscillospiraceae bacterium]
MKVAVIGAGTMGSGIAQAFAVHGDYQVILCDINIEFAENGKQFIQKNLSKLVAKEKIAQTDMDATLSRITPGLSDAAADADLVVESALEVMTVKKQLFKDLQAICKPETMFATNTSSLSVTELSAGLDRPVVGMHFFNPAPVMKLVEVISGLNTPPALAEKVTDIAKNLGKTPVQVKDSAGFVVNRVLVPMINEAIGVLADGVASAEDIDTAMKLGANHPMGPLALG